LTEVNLTATVSARATGSGTPSGSVQFVDFTTNAALGAVPIPASAVRVSFAIGPAEMASIIGHPIRAVFLENANFGSSTSNSMVVPALVNSAVGASTSFTSDELVSVFGSTLVGSSVASTTSPPGAIPLPTSLGATSVIVSDSAGTARPAGLYLTSPGQINFVVPAGTARGPALVTINNAGPLADVAVAPVRILIDSVAPGLFAAAQILRVHANGSQTLEDASSPIAMGPDSLYLVLFGTGIRNRTSTATVACTIHGVKVQVLYAGVQPQFPGLDQVDVLLPASLKGSGKVSVVLTVDGQDSNTIVIEFQ
jgi:uncharacterized protein (TIGR03437 family)